MGKIVQTAGRNTLGEFAPEFAHFNDDVLFGENWNNQDIDVKTRSIITVVALMASGITDSSLRYHLDVYKRQTHINRNEMLFGKSIEYALKGGAVDFTGNENIDYWETIRDEVRVCNGIKRMLDAGVNPDRMTISSDGQGSLPMYSSDGEFLGMGVGQSSCLLKEVKECVFKTKIPLEIAISTITSNPAEILRLKGKGKIEEGYDADLCILDQELQLVEVIAKGNTVYKK